MQNFINRVKEEPALLVQLVQAILGLVVTFDIIALSNNQTGGILGFVAAGLGLILGLSVRPFRWPLVTGLVQSAIVLIAAFGLELTSSQTAAIYSITAVIGAFVVRQAGTPETKLPALAPRAAG